MQSAGNLGPRNPGSMIKHMLAMEYKKQEEQLKISNRYQIEKKSQEEINDLLLNKFETGREEARKEIQSPSHKDDSGPPVSYLVSNLAPPLPCSRYQMNIESLQEIPVRDLEFKRNEGFYFKASVIAKPWKAPGSSMSINILLRDSNGDIARGQFYHATTTEHWSNLEKIFPDGKEVIILHPLYEKALDGLVSIRVENAYEFGFLDELQATGFAELLDKSKKLKDEANKAIKTSLSGALKKYLGSADSLLKSQPFPALTQDDFLLQWKIRPSQDEQKAALEHLAIVFSNISHVYFEEDRNLLALYYAKFSMWCNKGFLKARLRHAKALAHLLHLFEAQEELEILAHIKESEAFEKEMKDLSVYIRDQTEKYSSPTSIAKFMTEKFDFSNGKTYIGPIELVETEGKGRGYRARRNISRGEILLIERGYVFAEANPVFCDKLLTELDRKVDEKPLYMNLYPNNRCWLPLHNKENNELYKSVREKKTIFELYSSQHPRERKNFNSLEINQLLLKTQFNSFSVHTDKGIFANFCLLNHSCDPNASVWFIDNTAMLLAQRDIPEGDEIFVTYAPLICMKFERKEKLSNYGFECNCVRCQRAGDWEQREAQVVGIKCPKCGTDIAINDSKVFVCPKGCWQCDHSYYEKLYNQLKEEAIDLRGSPPETIEKSLINTLNSVEKQFPKYSGLRAIALHELARNYAARKNQEKFTECFDQIIEIANFYPFTELRGVFNNLLTDIVQKFKRAPASKELECLSYFGLSLEAAQLLWEGYVKSGYKEWFLRF